MNLSNCCNEKIISPDSKGHGRCSGCKENCVPLKDIKKPKQ